MDPACPGGTNGNPLPERDATAKAASQRSKFSKSTVTYVTDREEFISSIKATVKRYADVEEEGGEEEGSMEDMSEHSQDLFGASQGRKNVSSKRTLFQVLLPKSFKKKNWKK